LSNSNSFFSTRASFATARERFSVHAPLAGDSVPIAYSRIDPERARIDTLWFSHRWVIGGIIVGIAIIIRVPAGANLKQD
jgi:hypothetical protein